MPVTYCEPCGMQRLPELAVAELEGVPMCRPHLGQAQAEMKAAGMAFDEPRQLVQKPAPATPGQCNRGCGRPTHRGRCEGKKTDGRARLKRTPAGLQVAMERAQVAEATAMPDDRSPHYRYTPVTVAEAAAEIPKPAALRPKKAGVVLDTLQAEVIHDDDIPADAPVHVRNVGRLGQIWRDLDTLAPKQNLKIANRDRNHMSYTARCLRKGAKKRHRSLRIRENGTFLIVRFLTEGEEA